MSERDQSKQSGQHDRVLRCDECEDMIADALDGTLPPADAAAFARHQNECVSCAQLFRETTQGRDWLQYLNDEPEAPADLLSKILARTSGTVELASGHGIAAPAQVAPASLSQRTRGSLPALWHAARPLARHAVEPRLMMTVAMAFFSIALTLNLTGINLRQVRAADLQPSRLRATLARQYYSTNEQVTKYYLNLRLVYEMEARVRELRRSTEVEPAALQSPRPSTDQPQAVPGKQPQKPAQDGSGQPSSTVPKGELPAASRVVPDELVPVGFTSSPQPGTVRKQVFRAPRSTAEDQAERSLV